MSISLSRSSSAADATRQELESSSGHSPHRPGSEPAAAKAAMISEYTERLRLLVQQSGGTKQVAMRSGVALSTLGSYLAGGEMKLSTARQLCAACDTSLGWLVGDDHAAPGVAVRDQPEGFVRIRTRSRRQMIDDAAPNLLFSAAWMKEHLDCAPENLVAMQVQDAAMEPTLRHGDLLLIDTAAAAISSLKLHVIELAGEWVVRRLECRLDGSIAVHTDGERYPPQLVAAAEQHSLKLVGRVVWKGSHAPL